MCGRFSNRFTWKELHDLYRAFLDPNADPSSWTPKFNIAPTTQIPIIRFIDGQRRVDLMRWGLVPAWCKEIGKFATHNARGEEVTVKASFRGAWKAGRRCIIPASSFFEWKKLDTSAKPAKQPYAIGLGNQGPLGFAGLWEEWRPNDAASLLSATIITTGPNSLMEPIHNRMPVVLGDEQQAKWLGEEPAPPEELLSMLAPFPAERMAAWPVSKDVGQVKIQGDHLVEPMNSL